MELRTWRAPHRLVIDDFIRNRSLFTASRGCACYSPPRIVYIHVLFDSTCCSPIWVIYRHVIFRYTWHSYTRGVRWHVVSTTMYYSPTCLI